MKGIFLILILLTSSFLVQGKKDSTSTVRWTHELLYAPNISYRLLATSPDEKWHKEDRNNRETLRFGYSVKYGLIRRLNDRWSVGAGLIFSSLGYKTKAEELSWATPEAGFPTALRSTSKYFYIGIPVKGYYKLIECARITTSLIFGASFNSYEDKNVISEIEVDGIWTAYDNKGAIHNSLNAFAILGLDNSFRLNKRITLKANLLLNQSFISTNPTSATKEFLNYMEMELGLNYSFQKISKE